MMNPFKEVNWKPGTTEKRKFAVSLVIGFPALAAFFSLVTWLSKHTWNPFFLKLGVVGCVVGVVLWLIPQIAKPFYLAWYFIACCMGFVMGNILFSVFYFAVLTPIGILMRSLGKLSIQKGFNKNAVTYWRGTEKVTDMKRYYRQF